MKTVPKPRAILWDLFGDHLRYIDGDPVAQCRCAP